MQMPFELIKYNFSSILNEFGNDNFIIIIIFFKRIKENDL